MTEPRGLDTFKQSYQLALGPEVFSQQLTGNHLKTEKFHQAPALPKTGADTSRAWLGVLSRRLASNFTPDAVPNLEKTFSLIDGLEKSQDPNLDLQFIGEQLGRTAKAANLIQGLGEFLNYWSRQTFNHLLNAFGNSNSELNKGFNSILANPSVKAIKFIPTTN